MRSTAIDGKTFGRLTVISNGATCTCLCACGATVDVRRAQLLGGKTKSCGCLRRDIGASKNLRHGRSNGPEYAAWQNAKNRCERPADVRFAAYGGRGIEMRFRTFDAFLADIGPRPEGMTLDRIDPNGHYETGNVRWVDRKAQARNRRSNRLIQINGVTKCLAEWAEIYGQSCHLVGDRILRGWAPIDALEKPKLALLHMVESGAV